MNKVYILSETEFQEFQQAKERSVLAHFACTDSKERIATLEQHLALCKKQLAAKAHELLCKEAELASLSSDLRKVKAQLERRREISTKRLEIINHLRQELYVAKHNVWVRIATNPKTGTVRVVDASKVDAYRRFGWIVSEEYIVDFVDHPI